MASKNSADKIVDAIRNKTAEPVSRQSSYQVYDVDQRKMVTKSA